MKKHSRAGFWGYETALRSKPAIFSSKQGKNQSISILISQNLITIYTSITRLSFLAILSLLILGACANPSITSVDKSTLSVSGDGPVYIPRFEGQPDFVEEVTDMFVATLRQKTHRSIIQGDVLRAESTDIIGAGNIAPKQNGLSAAKAAGAGLLVLGKVTSHKTDMMLNGFVTARIIDVKTGNILGTIHRPSGLLVGHSEHQCVMAASKRAADALATNL